MFLREGLDKLMFTVREDDKYDEYPYRREIALKYGDRIQRLKFDKRWGDTIFLEKYPWQSWKYLGEYKHTYALHYFLRIDGLRQMRVVLNCQRLYNIQNNLDLYDKRLFDDNVVLPNVPFVLSEFIEMVQHELVKIKEDYIKLRLEIFGDTVILPDIVVDTHQIEMVQEAIGVHTSDLSTYFRNLSSSDHITVYHEQTNTHYLMTTAKRQLKMYQKGVGICRLEMTINTRPYDIVWNWQNADTDHIVRSLQAEFDDVLTEMRIPVDWYKIRVMSKNKFVWALADAIGLRKKDKEPEVKDDPDHDFDNGTVQWQLMKVLLSLSSWRSVKDTETMTRYLVRKNLLRRVERGKCVPTDRLLFLQDLYQKIEKSEGWNY